VTVVLAEIRGFKLVIARAILISAFWPGWIEADPSPDHSIGGRSRTVRHCRFSDADSAPPFRRRDVSAMVVANVLCEKMCVFETLWRLDYSTKDVCFISVFVVILMASGQCSFPPVRNVEELSATVTTCVKKYGLWRLFLLAWGVCEFTQKLSLDSIYCLIFHVCIILIAFHS